MAAADPTPAIHEAEKVAVHPQVVADAAIARGAVRVTIPFILRSVRLMVNYENYLDLMSALVYFAVIEGNVGHLDEDSSRRSPHLSIEDIAPDQVRRPVSILGVANSLGLPYETTRRHVNKLVRLGHCKRVRGGVIGTGATMQGPNYDRDVLANVVNLRRLYRALKRLGVDLD